MNFYKILNEEETHHGLKYHDGLNEDPLEFNPSGDCESGGIYFSREHILAFLDYGPWIRQVTLPKREPVYKSSGYLKKWKAKRVILGPKRRINLQVIKELVEEGANIHVDSELPLRWAIEKGYLDIIKFFIEKGADTQNKWVLREVAKHGSLDMIKVLVKGKDSKSYVLSWAAREGHLDKVKYLAEKGGDIHTEDDVALKWAAYYGHLNVVKYLVEKGADNDEALRWAEENKRTDVVEFLKKTRKEGLKQKS